MASVIALAAIIFPPFFYYLNETTKKKIEFKYKHKIEQFDFERIVYSNLIKITFEFQMLYVSLSDPCNDLSCVDDATSNFTKILKEYQNQIADYQIYLDTDGHESVYRFYQEISNTLIILKSIKSEKPDLAVVCVYVAIKTLTSEIIKIYNKFRRQLGSKNQDILPEDVPALTGCCGQEPTELKLQEYENHLFEKNFVLIAPRQQVVKQGEISKTAI
jgi:hypothetical protein